MNISLPQHTTEPLVFSPQVWLFPALTEAKVVTVGVGVEVGVGVGGTGVAVAVGVGVLVGAGTAVEVGLGTGVAVAVGVGVLVGVGTAVEVGLGTALTVGVGLGGSSEHPTTIMAIIAPKPSTTIDIDFDTFGSFTR